MALLPFSSKFGVQEVDRFSQSPSDFGLRHLDVPYMTNFLESRSACWKWRPLRRDFEQNLSIQETFPARFRIPMRSPKVFQVIKRVFWAGSSKIRAKNEGKRSITFPTRGFAIVTQLKLCSWNAKICSSGRPPASEFLPISWNMSINSYLRVNSAIILEETFFWAILVERRGTRNSIPR